MAPRPRVAHGAHQRDVLRRERHRGAPAAPAFCVEGRLPSPLSTLRLRALRIAPWACAFTAPSRKETAGSSSNLLSLTHACAPFRPDDVVQVPCPDPKAGLYVRARDGQVVHVRLPAGSMAFQMGDATQIHSGGALVATPHCVRAALGAAAVGVARNQFAVFIQPNYDEPMARGSASITARTPPACFAPRCLSPLMLACCTRGRQLMDSRYFACRATARSASRAQDIPPGKSAEEVGVEQWREGLDFGEFARVTVERFAYQ